MRRFCSLNEWEAHAGRAEIVAYRGLQRQIMKVWVKSILLLQWLIDTESVLVDIMSSYTCSGTNTDHTLFYFEEKDSKRGCAHVIEGSVKCLCVRLCVCLCVCGSASELVLCG